MDLIHSAHIDAWFLNFLAGIIWLFASFALVNVVYNIIFHPFAHYPGPLWARISPCFSLFHFIREDVHSSIVDCHAKYGSVVRWSPNRLIYNTPEALRDVYGHGRNIQKSQGYSSHPIIDPTQNMYNSIEKEGHGRKRRIIMQAFTPAAISAYEPMIIDHIERLLATILEPAKTGWPLVNANTWTSPHNIASWLMDFTLDIILNLMNAKVFDLIPSPESRWLATTVTHCKYWKGLQIAVPWVSPIRQGGRLSLDRWMFTEESKRRLAFSLQCAHDWTAPSEEKPSKRIDIFSTLLTAHDPKTGDKFSESEVWDQVKMMVIAGSRTTSETLSSVMSWLSGDANAYGRLKDEIRSTFSSLDSIRQGPLLTSCHYLRACLDETLRLTSPKAGPLWREVCPRGTTIDGQYVPGGYEVAVDLYALHRNPIYFPNPDVFDPDRFMPKSTMEPTLKKPKFDYFPTSRANTIFPTSPSAISPNSFQGMYFPSPSEGKDNPAFAPFLLGSTSCVGKSLAYLEMSLTLARLMWSMEFRAADSPTKGISKDPSTERTCKDWANQVLLQFKKREDLEM